MKEQDMICKICSWKNIQNSISDILFKYSGGKQVLNHPGNLEIF
jgi:hypothetical protein